MATERPSTPSPSEVARHHSELEEYERQNRRPPFILTYTEIKLLGIAGVSFVFAADLTTRVLIIPSSLQDWVLLGW